MEMTASCVMCVEFGSKEVGMGTAETESISVGEGLDEASEGHSH